MATRKLVAELSSENVFTESIRLTKGYFNFSLRGTWQATVTVQRSFDGGDTWGDVKDFDENGEYVGYEPEENVLYRFGIKAGNYTSGTVIGRLAQE